MRGRGRGRGGGGEGRGRGRGRNRCGGAQLAPSGDAHQLAPSGDAQGSKRQKCDKTGSKRQKCDKTNSHKENLSQYELDRLATIKSNKDKLDKIALVKIGKTVHIPHSVFPKETRPQCGYWVGTTVATSQGGLGDIGIQIEDEDIFTRPKFEVYDWIQPDAVA